eukprot:s6934_g1.t1
MLSRGTQAERQRWSMQLHLRKKSRRAVRNEVHLLEFLRSLERATKKTGRMQLRLFQRGRVFSKHGLLNACRLHVSNVGNRHVHRLSMSDFLEASYGPCHSVLKSLQKKSLMTASAVAVSMQVSVPYVQLMRTLTAGAYAARQIRTLARILALCSAEQPDCVGLRLCWDETQQWTTANFGKGPESGAFQICVVKMMLVVNWGSRMLKLPLVLPPLLVLTPSSQQLQWAMANHPNLLTARRLLQAVLDSAKAGQRLQ